MCSNSASKLGRGRSSGGDKVAAQPTCIWALGLSTARNDASSADSRWGGMGGLLPLVSVRRPFCPAASSADDPTHPRADHHPSLQNFQISPARGGSLAAADAALAPDAREERDLKQAHGGDSGIERYRRYGGQLADGGTGGRTCPPRGYQADAPET